MKVSSFTKEDDPASLEQVTLELNANELLELSKFFKICATEIKDDAEWEHEHLSLYLKRDLECDLVVFNADKTYS